MVMLCEIVLLLFEVLVFVCILAKLSIDMFMKACIVYLVWFKMYLSIKKV